MRKLLDFFKSESDLLQEKIVQEARRELDMCEKRFTFNRRGKMLCYRQEWEERYARELAGAPRSLWDKEINGDDETVARRTHECREESMRRRFGRTGGAYRGPHPDPRKEIDDVDGIFGF